MPYVPGRNDRTRSFYAAAVWSLAMPLLLAFGMGRYGDELHPSIAELHHQAAADEVLSEAMEMVHAFSYEAMSAMDGSTVRLGDGTQVRLAVAQATNGVLQVEGIPAVSGLSSFTTWRGRE